MVGFTIEIYYDARPYESQIFERKVYVLTFSQIFVCNIPNSKKN
jgi:hypothetical protein